MSSYELDILELVEIVRNKGFVKTGIDIYTHDKQLLIQKDVLIDDVATLMKIQRLGMSSIKIENQTGGVWNRRGEKLNPERFQPHKIKEKPKPVITKKTEASVTKQIKEIVEVKKEAEKKYKKAKVIIKQVISEIKDTGGEFDYQNVEDTVTDILNLITEKESAFSHITRELFSYDDYLYNHSVNVCTIGTAIMTRFNKVFSGSEIKGTDIVNPLWELGDNGSYFPKKELQNISIGYFLHDIGKVMIPDYLLNKQGGLTDQEFEIIKQHSYNNGPELLKKNNLSSPYIRNSVKLHHSPIYENEDRSYPDSVGYKNVPEYVKICKLADIYDAMTSKRSYKEAWNPIGVVTKIFRMYANKDDILKLVLHSFVKSIGILPPGSIVELKNKQMAYVLDSEGPIIIPFTDNRGKTLKTISDPLDLSEDTISEINPSKSLKSPSDTYNALPPFLQKALAGELVA
ncbi:MAG: HD domain-containing protein [Desulfobacterales bacterium]|nr:HD domain-containing protein [Desulfobacterales bacterium]MCP4158949.1 HD domain-containing protein [Deltaproteobacteria bacterium]